MKEKEIKYSDLAEVYEKLAKTSGRLGKVTIMAEFLKELKEKGKKEWVYLLQGRVVPDYDSRELGISRQIVIKALAHTYGIKEEIVVEQFRKIGDLGEIGEKLAEKKRQSVLFNSKLTVGKVYDNLCKLMDVNGKGSIERKIGLISELLNSAGNSEAKYIVRTLLSDLRIGVARGVLRDALAEAFFGEGKKEVVTFIEEAYDLAGDWAVVFESASLGRDELRKITIRPGKPLNVMLAVKVENIKEAFEVCGKPAALEFKYDGFRVLISRENNKIELFTRKLENVTKQFPDVVEVVKRYVKADTFILDSEVVGYNPKTNKYLPFEAVSQRIKRKYDIDKLIDSLPVEVNVFDVLYCDGKSTMNLPFAQRRKIVEKVVRNEEWKIRSSKLLITDSEEKAEEFYQSALKVGEEGIMIKNINMPYKQGRRVGYMAKLKPIVQDLDLVIVKAQYGSGKRGGLLTSYTIACRNGEKLLEVGKVSSGLKEKEEEGTSYGEMNKLLKPLIIEEKGDEVTVEPKIIVSVTYQNIQQSTSYDSGFALRFPRIARYRPDKSVSDIATLKDIEREVKKGR